MSLVGGMTDALSRYLDLSAAEMKVTAGNVANIDTPGYKTQGFDFEAEFKASLNGTVGGSYAGPKVSEVDGLVARPDGNTVSMDRESMALAKAQIQFRMGVSLLKGQFSHLMAAIHEDK